MMLIDYFSLDKELVKLAEKHAREREEREKREREKREREAQEQKSNNTQIQVKPIIETKVSAPPLSIKQPRTYIKMSHPDHDMNQTEDLLR